MKGLITGPIGGVKT